MGDNIKKVPGVVDVVGLEDTISGPAAMFNVDQTTTARAGFTPQEVETDTAAILQGEPATTPVVVNDRAYTIRVRFPARDAGHHAISIRNTTIVSGTGERRPLFRGSLSNMVEIPGQFEIRRENLAARSPGERAF